MKKMYLEYQGQGKQLVTSIKTDKCNSYEVLVTDADSQGFVLVGIRAINDMHGVVYQHTDRMHLEDFKEFY